MQFSPKDTGYVKPNVHTEPRHVKLSHLRDHRNLLDASVANSVTSVIDARVCSVNKSAVEEQLEVQHKMLDVIGVHKTSKFGKPLTEIHWNNGHS